MRKTTKKTVGEKKGAKKKIVRKATKKTGALKRTTKKRAAIKKVSPAADKQIPTDLDDYMNAQQVNFFRELLNQWRHNLIIGVDDTVHHMQDEAANFPDPADRATQEEGFTLELRTRDRERKLIKKIDEALAALGLGEYGYCEICGIEIGVSRLKARPTATLCIDCKTFAELKERQLG